MFRRAVMSGRSCNRTSLWAFVIAALAATAVQLCMSGAASAAPAPHGARVAAHRVRVLSPASVATGALAGAFAKRQGLPGGVVGDVRPGSVHAASVIATGRQWAIASFRPTSRLTATQQVALQDGADAGIFTRRGSKQPWTLAATGVEPLSCDPALPGAVRAAWKLAPAVHCGTVTPMVLAAARHHAQAHTTRADRIASIALSQVGESDIPVTTSFGNDCDPYTPMDGPQFAAPDPRGCGYDSTFQVENENEEWCSDFADWVWRNAGVTADMGLINAGANSFYAWGAAQHQPLTVDGTDPQVGDAVVFYGSGAITTSRGADHVGIVTAVNPDGTVNLVNGDFLGAHNISVQYNTDVDLSTWAAQVWGAGEQWVFVSPPTGAQPPIPTATVSGPHTVAADTETTFRVSGREAGGSISSEGWSFGMGNAVAGDAENGSVVHHVFTDPGRVTVTVIVTSSLGTITVKTWNVDVITPSSTVTSTPSDAVYYSDAPVAQRLFSVGSTGALTEESWDGAAWLDESLPGSWAASTPVTSLDYKDTADALTPHVFGRSETGALQEVSLNSTTWTARTHPGSPAPGSPIVASTIVGLGAVSSRLSYPAVFFFNRAGQLVESSAPNGIWTTSVVPGATGDQGLAIGTIDAWGAPAVTLYTTTPSGRPEAFMLRGGSWRAVPIADPLGVVSGSGLTAVDSGAAGDPGVFFVDGAGHLAEAAPGVSPDRWHAKEISSAQSIPADGLEAAGDVTSAGAVVDEVFAVGSAGAPQLVSDADGTWSTQTLPGSTGRLLGLAAYPVPGDPQTLLFSGSQGVEADTATSGVGPWSQATLPSTPVTFAGRVLLYAADSADYQAAVTAANDVGLAPSQVSGNFVTAWDDTISGEYVVISVGGPATSALYFNPCGWSNPDEMGAGSSPFSYVLGPTDQLPGSELYVNADGASASDTAGLAEDLAYYAVHGSLPPGVTSLPTQVGPTYACSGSPTAS